MRQKLASLALAACVALNLAVLPLSPAEAQVRLPALGEAESDQFSIDDERRVGEQIMREIRPDPAVVDDPVLFEYVDTIFQRLHAAARRRGDISDEAEEAFGWEPFLVNDRTFNAFALPGGYIGVHLGLIAASGSRDEMASVLGHELSHITQRHIARSMVANKHQSLVSMAAMLIGLLASTRMKNGDVPDGGDHERPGVDGHGTADVLAPDGNRGGPLRRGRDDRRRFLAVGHGRHVPAP